MKKLHDMNAGGSIYPCFNRLLRRCNQAALHSDGSTGIESYSRAINDTAHGPTRSFLLSNVAALRNFLGHPPDPSTGTDSPLRRRCHPKLPDPPPERRNSPVSDLIRASDALSKSDDKWAALHFRGLLFRDLHFVAASVVDLSHAVRANPRAGQVLPDLYHSAMLCSNREELDAACLALGLARLDPCGLRSLELAIAQEYGQALHVESRAKKRDSSIQAHLHLFFGDAISAHRCASGERNSASGEVIRYLASPEILTRLHFATAAGGYLSYVSARIYATLDVNIVDLPLSLDIPENVQAAWIKGEQVPNIPGKISLPERFDIDAPQPVTLDVVLGDALVVGEKMNQPSSNVRQHICFGLAYFQVIQMMSNPMSLTMDRAVAAVGHWMRVYDPTAALFDRRRNIFPIFASRNGIVLKQMARHYPHIFDMLKNGIARSAGADLARAIQSSKSVIALLDILRADCSVQYGETSFFVRVGEYQNYDLGLAVPSFDHGYDERYRSIDTIWRHLLLLHAGESSAEAAADFVSSAMRWIYEWMRFVPLADSSHFIGTVLFHALLSSYFGVLVDQMKVTPVVLQVEALLALNFDMFRAVIKQQYPMKLSQPVDLSRIPGILELFPTYNRRHWALWHVNESPQFARYFLKDIEAGISEEATAGQKDSPAQPPEPD
jgi:hypothetical protein